MPTPDTPLFGDADLDRAQATCGHTPHPIPISPLPKMVHPLGDSYTRGNTLRRGKTSTWIPEEEAKKLKANGRRGQHKGLLYDEAFPGFNPTEWSVVISENELSCRLLLVDLKDPNVSHVLDVHRNACPHDDPMRGIVHELLVQHAAVRTKDHAVGTMVGIGDHLDYAGQLARFSAVGEATDRSVRRRIQSKLAYAGQEFAHHFAGRDVGYEDLLEMQSDLWPRGGLGEDMAPPVAWDASANLGNALHTDRDACRSFAVWLQLTPGAPSSSWWLLFPHWGVAVLITDGTWVSWDGRACPHCTAVPRVAQGDMLMSLFASLPADMCRVFEREQACCEIIAARMTPGAKGAAAEGLFAELKVKMKVMLRWVPPAPEHLTKKGKRTWGKAKFRWLPCYVRMIDDECGTIDLRERSGSKWVHESLSASQIWNRLVIGWY